MTATLTLSEFYKKAGWPRGRAMRCHWQAFFSTFAFRIKNNFYNV
jgi:hypothetical protein